MLGQKISCESNLSNTASTVALSVAPAPGVILNLTFAGVDPAAGSRTSALVSAAVPVPPPVTVPVTPGELRILTLATSLPPAPAVADTAVWLLWSLALLVVVLMHCRC